MSSFNHNIRFLRDQLRLTREEFGIKLNEKNPIKPGRIMGWENENKSAPDSIKEDIAEKFNLDLGKFLTVQMTTENYSDFFLPEKVKDSRIELLRLEIVHDLDRLKESNEKQIGEIAEKLNVNLEELLKLVDDLKQDLLYSYRKQEEILKRL